MARDALHDQYFQVIGGLFSPVSDHYKKNGLAPAHHRMEMCQLAVEDSDWINVDSWELRQPSYMRTLLVLKSAKERLLSEGIDAQVMLLAGADLIKSFEVPGLWDPADVSIPLLL